jgi:hypothetical protein
MPSQNGGPDVTGPERTRYRSLRPFRLRPNLPSARNYQPGTENDQDGARDPRLPFHDRGLAASRSPSRAEASATKPSTPDPVTFWVAPSTSNCVATASCAGSTNCGRNASMKIKGWGFIRLMTMPWIAARSGGGVSRGSASRDALSFRMARRPYQIRGAHQADRVEDGRPRSRDLAEPEGQQRQLDDPGQHGHAEHRRQRDPQSLPHAAGRHQDGVRPRHDLHQQHSCNETKIGRKIGHESRNVAVPTLTGGMAVLLRSTRESSAADPRTPTASAT